MVYLSRRREISRPGDTQEEARREFGAGREPVVRLRERCETGERSLLFDPEDEPR
jgi:hypothetical protein